jgi:hypothetical protein
MGDKPVKKLTYLLCFVAPLTMAQVPRVAVTPGSNNAYAAGFSGNKNLAPVFATELPRVGSNNAFDLYDRSNPDVLVGPMPGVGALLAPVTPYLNESFYNRRDR